MEDPPDVMEALALHREKYLKAADQLDKARAKIAVQERRIAELRSLLSMLLDSFTKRGRDGSVRSDKWNPATIEAIRQNIQSDVGEDSSAGRATLVTAAAARLRSALVAKRSQGDFEK